MKRAGISFTAAGFTLMPCGAVISGDNKKFSKRDLRIWKGLPGNTDAEISYTLSDGTVLMGIRQCPTAICTNSPTRLFQSGRL